MEASKFISEDDLVRDGIVSFFVHEASYSHSYLSLVHAGDAILLHKSCRYHFLEVPFVLRSLLLLFDRGDMVEDRLDDKLIKTFIDEAIGLWELIKVNGWVPHQIPVFFWRRLFLLRRIRLL